MCCDTYHTHLINVLAIQFVIVSSSVLIYDLGNLESGK